MSYQSPLKIDQAIDRMDLVSWTFGNSTYDQNREIYIDSENSERSITANEARCLVRKLVAGFKALGLKQGDTVCIHAFNSITYSILLLGIIGAGGRFTGSNPAYTPAELSNHMKTTKARFLITEYELLPKVRLGVENNNLPAANVLAIEDADKDKSPSIRSWRELLEYGEMDWVRFEDVNQAKTTTAALLSTSGTTGLPKAAMISHYSLVVQNIGLNDTKDKPYTILRLLSIPEFHAFAFPLAHLSPLRDGITTYIMRRFELQRYLSAISRYQITETAIVPPILYSIVKISSSSEKLIQTLQLVWCAGAPLSSNSQDQMQSLLQPSARVVQVWGLTETGWITTFLWPKKCYSGSVGRLLLGMEAKLVGDDEVTIEGDNMNAEIRVRGPLLMQGYLDDSEASKTAFDEDGWLRTGDIGYKEHGKFFIIGRKKEMIKVRGWQVCPNELEATLLLHPDISDAAVIGIDSPENETELPRAYIVKASSHAKLSEADVKSFMATLLTRYKSLDGGVIFTDTLPRNSTGKVSKRVLKDRAAVEIRAERGVPSTNVAAKGTLSAEHVSDLAPKPNRVESGVTSSAIPTLSVTMSNLELQSAPTGPILVRESSEIPHADDKAGGLGSEESATAGAGENQVLTAPSAKDPNQPSSRADVKAKGDGRTSNSLCSEAGDSFEGE